MTDGLISIIIPIYNAGEYLSRAIDGLLAQEEVEFEIILIDDGSTDDSPTVCDRYSEQDSRIRVIHTPNGGPSAARNLGLDSAAGEFVFFMDADDTLDPDALKTLRKALDDDGSDWAIGDFQVLKGGVNLREDGYFFSSDRFFGEKDILPAVKDYLRKPRGASEFTNVWGKLFKTAVIRGSHIRFDEELKTWEDVVFNFDYLEHCVSMSYVHRQLYHYHVHPELISCGTRVFEQPLGFKDILKTAARILKGYRMPDAEIEAQCRHAAVYFAVKTLLVCFVLHARGKYPDAGKKQMKQLIRRMLNDETVRLGLHHYKPSAAESWLLPKLMKYRLTSLIYTVCRLKARRALRKEKAHGPA